MSDCRKVEQIRLGLRAQELLSLITNSPVIDGATFDPQSLEDVARELEDATFNDDTPLFPNDLCSAAITLDMLIS